MIRIGIDCTGGDNGSSIIVPAVKNFLAKNKEVSFVCFGNEKELEELKGLCEIVHAPDVVPMEAGPLEAMRMKDSSIYKMCQAAKEGKVDAMVSAGSTGGFLSLSTLILKTIEGVHRAAFIAPFPTKIKGKKVVILDIGASNENSPEELAQFAVIGSLYSKYILGVENPSVCLLSNGTEEGKGSPSGKFAYKLLKDKPYFKGNIEARNALSGECDVVVCDGLAVGEIPFKISRQSKRERILAAVREANEVANDPNAPYCDDPAKLKEFLLS